MKRALIVLGMAAMLAACNQREKAVANGGDPERGKQLIDQQYGCGTCHIIPGVDGAKGQVGPSLDHIASQPILTGKLPNNPDNMSKWLQNPQAIDPQNTMPNLGITPNDARDIAAYLRFLK